jgi:uncharacterized phage-associated protein
MQKVQSAEVRHASTVANEFMSLAAVEGKSLTPMQLLKLVYIAHGWMLGLHGEPLISNRIEAWKYGPVIPDLYHQIKRFRSRPVTEALKVPVDDSLNDLEADLVAQVYRAYGGMDGIQLSSLTHQPGTPWDETFSDDSWAAEISNDLIEHHYQGLAAKYAAKQQQQAA